VRGNKRGNRRGLTVLSPPHPQSPIPSRFPLDLLFLSIQIESISQHSYFPIPPPPLKVRQNITDQLRPQLILQPPLLLMQTTKPIDLLLVFSANLDVFICAGGFVFFRELQDTFRSVIALGLTSPGGCVDLKEGLCRGRMCV
jgi:hypothetical protein